jgi:type IV secretory pathway VirB4 component
MLKSNGKDQSLAHELPYWDFVEASGLHHAILNDGSLVGGLRVSLMDIECLDDQQINGFTAGLRSALNSVAEGTSVQFAMTVRSDFTEVIDAHVEAQALQMHPLVKTIADYREQKLRAAQEAKELYRPQLFVYLRTPMVESKKIRFFKKKEMFSETASAAYQETLEMLSQNIVSGW